MQISTPKLPKRFIPLVIVFAVLVLLMPRTAKFSYDYKKGTPWPYETLISQFDFPILKTEEQMQEERESTGTVVVPYYRFSDEVTSAVIKNVQSLDLGRMNYLRPAIVTRLNDIYAKGVISDGRIKLEHAEGQLSENLIYVQHNKRATQIPRTEVYKLSEAQDQLVASMAVSYPSVNLDSLFRRASIYEILVPNLLYDKSMTELSHAGSSDYISPTLGYVRADEKIVSKGEIVTAEVAQILDSYKEEYNKMYGYGAPRVFLYLGNILLALALVVVLYFCIYFTNKTVFEDRNRYFYLLSMFLLVSVITFVLERVAPGVLYMMPFPVFALYLLAFFRKRLVLPVYTVCLLPLLIFCGNGMELFVMYLVAGAVTLETFGHFTQRW